MPRRRDDVQYLQINDFSPGIAADYRLNTGQGGSIPANLAARKPGEAIFRLQVNISNNHLPQTFYTRGFYSDDRGHLVPLPILRWDNPTSAGTLNAGDTFSDVAGFAAVPAVALAGNPPSDDIWAWIHVLASTPRDTMRVFRNGGTAVKSHQPAAGTTLGPTRGITQLLSRGKRSAFASPAGPELFWEWTSGEPHTDGSTMFYEVWPDPNATNTDTSFEETGVVNNAAFLLGGQILAHNGRIIRLCEQNHAFGAPTRTFYSNERIRNTDPPNSVSLASTTTDSIIDPQNPNNYGAWGSLTYGELLVIKQYGGAILIEGDVYAPQITRLPGVQSTGQHISEVAQCAKGLVYMTDDGPYLWQGGAESQRLGFPGGAPGGVGGTQGAIIPLYQNFAANGGSGITCGVCAYNNLVIFSGGAVWDSVHGNWWALEVPYQTLSIPFFRASPTFQAQLIGITSGVGNSGRVEVYRWLPTQATGHLTQAEWISAPIEVNYDTIDIVSVEISFGAMPPDANDVTCAVYLMNINGEMDFVAQIIPNPTNNDGTWRIRVAAGTRARYIMPAIFMFNNNGNIPCINEIVIGYREAGSFGAGQFQ